MASPPSDSLISRRLLLTEITSSTTTVKYEKQSSLCNEAAVNRSVISHCGGNVYSYDLVHQSSAYSDSHCVVDVKQRLKCQSTYDANKEQHDCILQLSLLQTYMAIIQLLLRGLRAWLPLMSIEGAGVHMRSSNHTSVTTTVSCVSNIGYIWIKKNYCMSSILCVLFAQA